MVSAFYILCPRYSGLLAPTAPMTTRLRETFTIMHLKLFPNKKIISYNVMDTYAYIYKENFPMKINAPDDRTAPPPPPPKKKKKKMFAKIHSIRLKADKVSYTVDILLIRN